MPLSVLDALTSEPKLTGVEVNVIVRRLQALRPAELDRVRAACLMSRLAKAGGRLRIEDAKALDPGDLTISKARAAGWIRSDGQAWALTPEGRRLLDDEASRDDSRPWIHFVEERLGERSCVRPARHAGPSCPGSGSDPPSAALPVITASRSMTAPPSLSVPGKT